MTFSIAIDTVFINSISALDLERQIRQRAVGGSSLPTDPIVFTFQGRRNFLSSQPPLSEETEMFSISVSRPDGEFVEEIEIRYAPIVCTCPFRGSGQSAVVHALQDYVFYLNQGTTNTVDPPLQRRVFFVQVSRLSSHSRYSQIRARMPMYAKKSIALSCQDVRSLYVSRCRKALDTKASRRSSVWNFTLASLSRNVASFT